MKMPFRFWGGTAARRPETASMADWCVFCRIARRDPTSDTVLLYSDDRVVAFRDINPSAFRHYLVIPIEHIDTVNNLQRSIEHHQLVSHMMMVGKIYSIRMLPIRKNTGIAKMNYVCCILYF
ncbi:hypothetical protein GUJ93_ZPchr0014g46574 [Zizania palustris]|uniref:HIT domain-containing protein n=1 Tax=Zizania palustris TaxID=103762 RepID=A0A8J5TAJ4_ZIZPA|nr:hypothetical protein GUJ93_ZPchr0014g46574 [Zizania palustris]KAG8082800.1 hypothetical protein GUJ93_ZPchr0014g46574 [Zizania palustris]